MKHRVKVTGDGSHTLIHTSLDESYHSTHGAITESRHVFINAGIAYWASLHTKPVRVLEMGFGTGLNCLLTCAWAARHQRKVDYVAIEKYPIPWEQIKGLNHGELTQNHQDWESIHAATWNLPVELGNMTLTKTEGDLLTTQITSEHDVIFYDAFAPSTQPELWTLDTIRKLTDTMSINGVFVTYSAKGQLKRDLKSLGLVVETLDGPPGKLQMTRAIKV